MKVDIDSILKTTKGELISGDKKQTIGDFGIDSRIIKPHEAFIAIKGERYDGYDFIEQAYKKGVRFFITKKYKRIKPKLENSVLIKVENTREALAQIAHLMRKLHGIPVIGITGSNGKTTTKDMAAAILDSKYNVLRNIGTQNNEIGLPLTLLKLKKQHNIAILEMGMNHPGEIKKLNSIASANVGIITCIHPVHLKYLKNIENITKAKWELIRTLKAEKIAILNNDDENIKKMISKFKGRLITFGIKNKSDFTATNIKLKRKKIIFKVNRKHEIILNLIGGFNIYNALAAISASRLFNVSYDKIKNNLLHFRTPPMRMKQIRINGINLINDGYNANPKSLMLAIDTLSNLTKRSRSIIVCCDMLELGKFSKDLHAEIGYRVAQADIDYLITMGKDTRWTYKAALENGMDKNRTRHTTSPEEVASVLRNIAKPGDTILLKGSRLMKTEEIVKCFMNYYTH